MVMMTTRPEAEQLSLPLSDEERELLQRCEINIRSGMTGFWLAANALTTVRERRLYREGYATFDDYCRERWDITRSRADRLIGAFSVVDNLTPMGIILPENERQARELTALPPDKQQEAWRTSVETAPDGKVTASHIHSVVQTFQPDKPAKEAETVGSKALDAFMSDDAKEAMAFNDAVRKQYDPLLQEQAEKPAQITPEVQEAEIKHRHATGHYIPVDAETMLRMGRLYSPGLRTEGVINPPILEDGKLWVIANTTLSLPTGGGLGNSEVYGWRVIEHDFYIDHQKENFGWQPVIQSDAWRKEIAEGKRPASDVRGLLLRCGDPYGLFVATGETQLFVYRANSVNSVKPSAPPAKATTTTSASEIEPDPKPDQNHTETSPERVSSMTAFDLGYQRGIEIFDAAFRDVFAGSDASEDLTDLMVRFEPDDPAAIPVTYWKTVLRGLAGEVLRLGEQLSEERDREGLTLSPLHLKKLERLVEDRKTRLGDTTFTTQIMIEMLIDVRFDVAGLTLEETAELDGGATVSDITVDIDISESESEMEVENRKENFLRFMATELHITVQVKRTGHTYKQMITTGAQWMLPEKLKVLLLDTLIVALEERQANREDRIQRHKEAGGVPESILKHEYKLLAEVKSHLDALREVRQWEANPGLRAIYSRMADEFALMPLPTESAKLEKQR